MMRTIESSRDSSTHRLTALRDILASLNHPHIASIYDLQEANGVQFLVLELVEGETLAERIQRGPMAVEDAAAIAKHICEALESAHSPGIVHRDLKPANIKVTPDGTAFGCVLYEMLTGHAAFKGETVTDIIAKVIEGRPDWTLLPAETPPTIRLLIESALTKDRKDRLQHAALQKNSMRHGL
jgi:serine/threonine protein kinase